MSIDNITIRVGYPELSEAVQKIVFKHGIVWADLTTKVDCTDRPYLNLRRADSGYWRMSHSDSAYHTTYGGTVNQFDASTEFGAFVAAIQEVTKGTTLVIQDLNIHIVPGEEIRVKSEGIHLYKNQVKLLIDSWAPRKKYKNFAVATELVELSEAFQKVAFKKNARWYVDGGKVSQADAKYLCFRRASNDKWEITWSNTAPDDISVHSLTSRFGVAVAQLDGEDSNHETLPAMSNHRVEVIRGTSVIFGCKTFNAEQVEQIIAAYNKK